tara:strand:+ start:5409 stop:7073 length:1665 start_codon:yes stop_codon:yes gene_type:complete
MCWITDLVTAHNDLESVVALVKTRDPVRVKQFVDYIAAQTRDESSPARAFFYDAHLGLLEVRQVEKDGVLAVQMLPMADDSQPTGGLQSMVATMGGGQNGGIAGAVPKIDPLLRNDDVRALVAITNIVEKNPSFTAALRSWAIDATTQIYSTGSMVALFDSDPIRLVGQETVELSMMLEPERSALNERERILRDLIDAYLPDTEVDEDVRRILRAMNGMTLRDTETALLRSINEHASIEMDAVLYMKDLLIRKEGVLVPLKSTYGFEAAGIDHAIAQGLNEYIIGPLRTHPDAAKALKKGIPRGVLFIGPPGTGKTWTSEAFGKELGYPLMKTGKVFSKWLGESQDNMSRVQQICEAYAPVLMLFDEVDRLGKRGGDGHAAHKDVFGTLLSWMGDADRRTVFIATTNVPDQLDDAFIREGRFDLIIPLLYPGREAKLKIFKVHTSIIDKVPMKKVDFESLVDMTPKWSGAEIKGWIEKAKNKAIADNGRKHLLQRDFLDAHSSVRVNEGKRIEMENHFIDKAREYASDESFVENVEAGLFVKQGTGRAIRGRSK